MAPANPQSGPPPRKPKPKKGTGKKGEKPRDGQGQLPQAAPTRRDSLGQTIGVLKEILEAVQSGRAYRGLAVLVHRKVIHQLIPIVELKTIQALGVLISVAGEEMRIFSIYRPPGNTSFLDKQELRSLMSADTPTVIAGDLNCKHTLWNSNRICRNGSILYQDSMDHHYEVIGPDTWTHYEANGSGDVIDVVVYKGLRAAPELSVMPDLPSDHRPVLLVLKELPSRVAPPQRRQRICWDSFQREAQDRTTTRPVESSDDVERATEELTIVIQESLTAASYTSAPAKPLAPLPARIRALIRDKRDKRKLWQETRCPRVRTELNALVERLRTALDDHAADGWDDHISAITDDVPSVHRGLKSRDRSKVLLLRPLLREQDIDVVLLSETILKPTDSVKFPGYISYRQDELNQDGRPIRGLLVLVKRKIRAGIVRRGQLSATAVRPSGTAAIIVTVLSPACAVAGTITRQTARDLEKCHRPVRTAKVSTPQTVKSCPAFRKEARNRRAAPPPAALTAWNRAGPAQARPYASKATTSGVAHTLGTQPDALKAREGPKYPLLVVEKLDNWSRHFKIIAGKLGRPPNGRPYGQGIRFSPEDEQEYRLIQSYLTELGKTETISWFSYSLPAERSLKVAIRGLPSDTDVDEIVRALEGKGFAPEYVKNIKGRQGRPGSIFYALVKKTPNLTPGIFDTTELLMMPGIIIEAWRGKKGPAQCHRCQKFRHSSHNCHREQACVRCGEPHKAGECPRPREEPATCANCGGAHPANFHADTPTVIAGDLNCKHTLWNSNRICRNGSILYQDSMDHHYEVIGPDTWTHYEANGSGDMIDVVVYKGLRAAPELSVMPDLPSDHRPVLLVLKELPSRVAPPQRRQWICWDSFQREAQDRTTTRPVESSDDVERATEELTIAIQDSLTAASHTSAPAKPLAPLPARIKALICDKRDKRKLWQETRCSRVRSELNALVERLRTALDDHAADGWDDHISAITDDVPSVYRHTSGRGSLMLRLWYPFLKKTNRRRIQAQENITLRKIVKAPRYVRNYTIQRDLKIENIDSIVRRLTTSMFERVDSSKYLHIAGLAPQHARQPDEPKKRKMKPTAFAVKRNQPTLNALPEWLEKWRLNLHQQKSSLYHWEYKTADSFEADGLGHPMEVTRQIPGDTKLENLDIFVRRLTTKMFSRSDGSSHDHIREIASQHARPPDEPKKKKIKSFSRDYT
ncbi:Gag-like protein [Operophtera brumata]|uniref:Gag-like protein n=1 Tax=Operophtera brumata TaxID=104452 RepID=A0A0L7KQW1_OPEBR|nr:Gag-like protein [Operophtera brumata]